MKTYQKEQLQTKQIGKWNQVFFLRARYCLGYFKIAKLVPKEIG